MVAAEGTTAFAVSRAYTEEAFVDWLERDGAPALISRSHGRFYVHCIDFGVAGAGASKEEAVSDATRLLTVYLQAAYVTGLSYEQAQKPIPRGIRFRLWLSHVREHSVKGLRMPITRFGKRAWVPVHHDGLRFS
jgi:hypothetical protein